MFYSWWAWRLKMGFSSLDSDLTTYISRQTHIYVVSHHSAREHRVLTKFSIWHDFWRVIWLISMFCLGVQSFWGLFCAVLFWFWFPGDSILGLLLLCHLVVGEVYGPVTPPTSSAEFLIQLAFAWLLPTVLGLISGLARIFSVFCGCIYQRELGVDLWWFWWASRLHSRKAELTLLLQCFLYSTYFSLLIPLHVSQAHTGIIEVIVVNWLLDQFVTSQVLY